MNDSNSSNYQALLNKYVNHVRSTLKPKFKLESGFEAQLPLPPTKTFSLLFPVLAIIFVAVLLSIYIWFRPSSLPSPSASIPTPSPSPATSPTPGLYQNQEFGFELKYPATFTEFQPDMPYYRLSSVLLALNGNQSYLTIAYDPEPGGCGEAKEGWQTLTLNDVNFLHRSHTSAGAGDQYYSDFYRTIIKDKCFEIAAIIHIKTNGDKTSAEDIVIAKAELKQLVSTFRFL